MNFSYLLCIIKVEVYANDNQHEHAGFRVARLVDENGAAVILKNNVPRYLVVEFGQAEAEQLAADEDVMAISKRLIEKNRQAYEVLAK